MEKIELFILIFGILFIVVFNIDYFFILKPKLNKKNKSENKMKWNMEIEYLHIRYGFNKKSLNKKWIYLWIALLNALIISVVSAVVLVLPINTMYRLMIGFILLVGSIYSVYDIFGKFLIKKGIK